MEQAFEVIVGFLVVPLVGFIKKYTGWEGKAALWLSVGMSLVCAIVYQVIVGTFTPFEPANFLAAVAVVLSSSQVIYKQFFADK